jgi:hypothetical protein
MILFCYLEMAKLSTPKVSALPGWYLAGFFVLAGASIASLVGLIYTLAPHGVY